MTEVLVREMRGVGVVRRRRGPELTERDGAALRWLGEQYGARLDVLGVLLGRLGGAEGPLSLRTVRDLVDRWERLGLCRCEKLPGGGWVTLTAKGLGLAGLEDLSPWKMPLLKLRHTHAVNAVRLAYEGTSDAETAPWVSERLTWQERVKQSWHVPDGVIKSVDDSGSGSSVAVEVELKRKHRREYREDVFGKLRKGVFPVRVVWYLVPDERFREKLTAELDAVLGAEPVVRFSVRVLPVVPGVAYMDRW